MSHAEAPAVSLPTNPLAHERAVLLEDLEAVVHPIADVDESLVRKLHAMDGVAEDRRGVRLLIVRRQLAVDGRPAVRAPVPLVLAGIGIEHDDAAVAVAVGHVDLVGLGVDADVGRTPQPRRVVAAAERAGAADLQQERAVARELQDLAVTLPVAPDPDVVQVVDEDAVLLVRPLVAVAGTAPGLDDVALLVELDHRRRRHAALGGRWVDRRAALAVGQRSGPVQHPDVVARVDGHTDDVPEQPLVRQRLRPERVHLQRSPRHVALRRGGAVERALPEGERDAARDNGRRHPRLLFPLHRYLLARNRDPGRPARALARRSSMAAHRASGCNR